MKECGAKENWTIRKTSEMLKHLVDIAWDRFETYAAPFHALHSTGTFNRNCQVTGCAALKGPKESFARVEERATLDVSSLSTVQTSFCCSTSLPVAAFEWCEYGPL